VLHTSPSQGTGNLTLLFGSHVYLYSRANAARSPLRVVSWSSPAPVTGILSPSLDLTPSILQPRSFVVSSAGLYPSRSRPSRKCRMSLCAGADTPSERQRTIVTARPSLVEVCCKQFCSRILCSGCQPRSRQTTQEQISAILVGILCLSEPYQSRTSQPGRSCQSL
jgi:hypothetical protein